MRELLGAATDVGYLGAMGSRRTNAERERLLIEAGMTKEQIGRVHSPIGLDLGARTPEETAVCAEIIQLRTGRPGGPLRHGRDGPTVRRARWLQPSPPTAPPIAAASYDGMLRTPVRLPRSVWADLPAVGDQGARVLMRSPPDLVQGVTVSGVPDHIDTTEDLRRWN